MSEIGDPRHGALREAMQALIDAWSAGSLARVKALVSPSYTHGDIAGQHLTREAWLAEAARRHLPSDVSFRDVKLRFFGGVGLATGYCDIGGGPGSAFLPPAIAFTQVWREEDGHWLMEAFQATPAGDPAAAPFISG